jgi:hypothetical protein
MRTQIIHHVNEDLNRICFTEKRFYILGFLVSRKIINRLQKII